MIATGYTDRIARIYDLTAGVTPTSVTLQGPLGQEAFVPAASHDQILGYVLVSSGVLQAGGSRFADSAVYKAAPTNYRAIVNPANMGAQRWIPVVNQSGATIERGQLVKWDVAGFPANKYSVIVAATTESANRILGAAQWDIADDKISYILAEGYGVVIQGEATPTAGDVFKPDTGTAGRALLCTDPDEASCGQYVSDGFSGGASNEDGGSGEQTPAIMSCKR